MLWSLFSARKLPTPTTSFSGTHHPAISADPHSSACRILWYGSEINSRERHPNGHPTSVDLNCKGVAKESLTPAAYIIYSEPLPHCIAHGKPDYEMWNKRWQCYNKLVQQMRQKNLGLDVIHHKRLWLSYCSADPDYYNLQKYFYGLYLNQVGCMIFSQDIISFVST